MRVGEALSFGKYWEDPRFASKRPNLAGSRKMTFGDNIYHRDGDDRWVQLDSHHSLHDGSANPLNVATDTRVDRVLVSQEFIYWGGGGPPIPSELRALGEDAEDLCSKTRGQRRDGCRGGGMDRGNQSARVAGPAGPMATRLSHGSQALRPGTRGRIEEKWTTRFVGEREVGRGKRQDRHRYV
jgi:hypothetical protein